MRMLVTFASPRPHNTAFLANANIRFWSLRFGFFPCRATQTQIQGLGCVNEFVHNLKLLIFFWMARQGNQNRKNQHHKCVFWIPSSLHLYLPTRISFQMLGISRVKPVRGRRRQVHRPVRSRPSSFIHKNFFGFEVGTLRPNQKKVWGLGFSSKSSSSRPLSERSDLCSHNFPGSCILRSVQHTGLYLALHTTSMRRFCKQVNARQLSWRRLRPFLFGKLFKSPITTSVLIRMRFS